ncbi:MAG: agmatine deiminase family protein [Kofleriaceae bacterium]
MIRVAFGIAMGIVASALIVFVFGAAFAGGKPGATLVPEDASGHLRRIAIHYAPAMDARAMPVWRELFRVLPADVAVEVAVARREDFDRFVVGMRAEGIAETRFRAVVVGHPITTWSRDRMAALATPSGGSVLAPPRVSTVSGARAGDWEAPFALAREVYQARPQIAELVFEGGDLAASKRYVFADANLIGRNLGRGDATRAHLEGVLERTFDQEIVWLGDAQGDVPEHHIMMYMVPLDDHEVLVGDVRRGRELAPDLDADEDLELHAARFDRVAAQLAARGFTVRRVPVVVLPGAGSYVTYTNALFDRDATGPIVYLPTYSQPALDREATLLYESLGYRVIPIDVTSVYRLNGSLGCLVNVMARD